MVSAAVFGVLPPAVPAAAAPGNLPFETGEKLSYSVRWEMVRAGRAQFLVHPPTRFEDVQVRHFELKVRSNRYVDMLYKIRDRMEAYTDMDLTRSEHYRKVQDGKDKKQIEVDFDWTQKTVTYSNFGGRRDPVAIPEHTFDPLASFYKIRTTSLSPGKTLSFPVTDGKKCFIQKAHVKEKQTIQLNGKTYDTFLIVPEVNHFSGVFEKSENPTVSVWVSADEKKIPVRIKVKVFIGSLVFDLDRAE